MNWSAGGEVTVSIFSLHGASETPVFDIPHDHVSSFNECISHFSKHQQTCFSLLWRVFKSTGHVSTVSFLKAWSPEGRVSRNGAHRQLICVCHHLVLRRASVAFGENAVLLGMAPRTCKRLCHFRKSARGG